MSSAPNQRAPPTARPASTQKLLGVPPQSTQAPDPVPTSLPKSLAVVQPKGVTSYPPLPPTVRQIVDPLDKAMALLVKEMGFPPAAAKSALASCDNGMCLDVEKAIAMLLSDSKFHSDRVNTPVERIPSVGPAELDSTPIETQAPSLPMLDRPRPVPQASSSQTKRQSTMKTNRDDVPAYTAQTKLLDFVERANHREQKQMIAQRRQSKAKAYKVLGVSDHERRVLSMAIG